MSICELGYKMSKKIITIAMNKQTRKNKITCPDKKNPMLVQNKNEGRL